MEHLLKAKDKELDQLNNDKKINDKIRKEQDKTIETLKQEKQYYFKVTNY